LRSMMQLSKCLLLKLQNLSKNFQSDILLPIQKLVFIPLDNWYVKPVRNSKPKFRVL
jgi:hypothetical protein